MAQCPYCQKHVADSIDRCPHCFTLLTSTTTSRASSRGRSRGKRISSGSSLPIKPATLLRLPASRLALVGCLGLLGALLVVAIIFAIVAPQSARVLLLGPPTPLPPTPRPTPTPSPIPTATPEWTSYQGRHASYSVSFPPNWIILDFADPGWKRDFRDYSQDFPWLRELLSEDRLQDEENAGTLWAFDPGRAGEFSVRCRLERSLAGLTTAEIRDTVRAQLLQIPSQLGGRSSSGARTEPIEIDGQPAIASELVVVPGVDSEFDEPIRLQFYLLADEKQGYWIEVRRPEDESAGEDQIIEALLGSFHRLEGPP